MSTPDDLTIAAIDPDRLGAIRKKQQDERGEPIVPLVAEGWEPLRCCLTLPAPGDKIALLSYSPFPHTGPWAESGPVYVHAEECAGYRTPHELPAEFRTGPRILRTYRADGTLDYAHVTLVPEGEDVEAPLASIFAHDEVETVHVRAMLTQCFTYAVSR